MVLLVGVVVHREKDHELIKRLIEADKAVRGHESLNLRIEKEKERKRVTND